MIITICIVIGLVALVLGTWLYCAFKLSGTISKNEDQNK